MNNNRPEIPLTTPILLEIAGFNGPEPTPEFLGHVSLARAWLSIQKPTKSTLVAPEAAVRSAGEWLERHHLGHVTELSSQVLVAACLIEGFPVRRSKRQPDHPRLGISRKTLRRDSTRKLVAKRERAKAKKQEAENKRIRAELRRRYKQLERWKKRGSPPATRPWFVKPPPTPAPAPVFPVPVPDCLNQARGEVEPPAASPVAQPVESSLEHQRRMSVPHLTWLRRVCLEVKEAGRLGDSLRASHVARLCEKEGVYWPRGICPSDVRAASLLAGRTMMKLFRDAGGDTLTVDGFRVTRASLVEYDTARRQCRTRKVYTFELEIPVLPPRLAESGTDPRPPRLQLVPIDGVLL